MYSPKSLINAGTKSALINVASIRIAKATPKPNSLIEVTPLVRKAANTIARINAAAVIIRADFCNPSATASTLDLPASCSYLILESKKTS